MSIESLSIALNHSRSRGAAKLVLIGIANHDGDGGAWPSIATLAKYAGVHPRNVQKSIDRLSELGEIRREIQRGGTSRTESFNRPNLYTILLTCPPECDGTRNHRSRVDPTTIALLDAPTPAQVALISNAKHGQADPLAVAPPPGGSATPPLAVAPPEPSFNQTTIKASLPNSPNSTKVVEESPSELPTWEPCPARPTWPHSPGKDGLCIDCNTELKAANHD